MIRPLHDWILVRLDPLSQMRGEIYAPNATRVRTATVLRAGPGRAFGTARTPLPIAEGDRVAFFREHLEHRPGRAVMAALSELEDDVGFIRLDDILFAMAAGETVEVE